MGRLVAFLATLLLLVGTPVSAANRCAPSANPGPGACTTTHASVMAAIAAAAAGDFVYGHAGTTYTETITLPNKGVLTDFITITTDADPANLPATGVRTSPSYKPFMPSFASVGGGSFIVNTAAGANHYKLRHIYFPAIPYGFNTQMILGEADSGQQFESQEPSYITVDQCIFAGDPLAGQNRAIAVNGKNIAILNSYFTQIVAVGQDSQCIAGWNGHGPLDVENNFLECGTENFIIGGSDPHIRTYLSVTGSASTTSAAVATTEASHTLAELHVGQVIGICTSSASATACCPSTGSLSDCEQGIRNFKQVEFATIVSVGTGSTGTITWTPATTVAPNTTGLIRGGAVLDGLIFRYNYVVKNLAWMTSGVLGTPLMSSAAVTDGGTLAGTYYYKAQIWNDHGYANNPVRGQVATTEVNGTAATQKITVAYSAVSYAGYVRMFRGTSAGGENQYVDCATAACLNGTFVDDGSLTWTSGSPGGYDTWVIKNLFELKAVYNAQVDSNIFIYQWKGGDLGYVLWLKSVNQEGGCWWCASNGIVLEKNLWAHMDGFLLMNGRESEHGPRPPAIRNVTLRNNLAYDSTPPWAQGGEQPFAIVLADDIESLTLDHNTIIHTMVGLMQLDGLPGANPVFTNNMFRGATYGIKGAEGDGTAGLDHYLPGWAFHHNSMGNLSSSGNPAGNTYESLSAWQAEFTNYSDSGVPLDYVLASSSLLKGAGSDFKDVGADIALILTATANVVSGGGSSSGVPSPWTSVDVGTVGIAGNASYTSGVFTLNGSGADIYDTEDAFQFVYQTAATAVTLVARVVTEQNTDDFAKAGIMVRQSTAKGSPHVILSRKPDGTVEFMQRTTLDGSTTFITSSAQGLPVWLRLAITGVTVTGSASTNGTTWTTIGSTTITPGSNLVGMVVNSHDNSVLNTSTFDSVAVTTGIVVRSRLRVR